MKTNEMEITNDRQLSSKFCLSCTVAARKPKGWCLTEVVTGSAVHPSVSGHCVMPQWRGLFLLMAIVFPAVMNSLDGAPHAASIALSHRRLMEIGPSGEA